VSWQNKIYEAISEAFGNKVFYTKNVTALCKEYSKGTLYRAIHDLIKDGKITSLGKGIYKIKQTQTTERSFHNNLSLSVNMTIQVIPGSPTAAKKLLHNQGIEFMITGLPVFFNHIHQLPRRVIIQIYVICGAGEHTIFTLRKANYHALLNPSLKEIKVLLETVTDRDIFVIREYSELTGNINGMASVERALVDLYFEATREKIPFSNAELAKILLNVFRNEPINYSQLKKFANKRAIRNEMEAILDHIDPQTEKEPLTPISNKHGTAFMELLRKIDWR